MLGGPPELQDAIKDFFSHNALPTCGIFRLPWLGHVGRGDYRWGFKIYRTTYNRPDSDARFAKAMQVLNNYIRHELFSYKDDGRHKGNIPQPPLDGKANEELWNRLSNEAVEDRALLEGASEAPAKTKDSPRYRFFLVFDDEVIDHLLQLPKPADHKASIPAVYSVKVFDARFNSPAEFSGAEDSDSDAEEEDVTDDFFGFEGWLWTPASLLAQLWFCDYQSDEELITTDDFWEKLRLVYGKAMWRYTLPRSSKFWEDASLRQ